MTRSFDKGFRRHEHDFKDFKVFLNYVPNQFLNKVIYNFT